MSTDGAPAHTLGPHVVGLRVVVRRVLRGQTGPTGGPAMTDVLGVCESWPAEPGGVVTLRREDGTTVDIATADIVSGKPVPPRPSVRHRISAYDAELHTGSLWPQQDTEPLGGWLLRSAPAYDGRLRRRANSVLAMRDPGLPLPETLAAVTAFYDRLGQPPLAQVEIGSDQDDALIGAGWQPLPDGSADYLIASVSRALRAAGRQHLEAPERSEDLVTCTVSVAHGIGRAALDGDWIGLHSLAVEPAHRGRGLGTALVTDLLEWGASHGATTAWLHVEQDNPDARRLYERLGFGVHHATRYLRGPGQGALQTTEFADG